jgi:hypothetical protein
LCFAGEQNDGLYKELWKLCAGPMVDVPDTGEQILYFPQGHMEQVCIFFFDPFVFCFVLLVYHFCDVVVFNFCLNQATFFVVLTFKTFWPFGLFLVAAASIN